MPQGHSSSSCRRPAVDARAPLPPPQRHSVLALADRSPGWKGQVSQDHSSTGSFGVLPGGTGIPMMRGRSGPPRGPVPSTSQWLMLRGLHKASSNWLGRIVMAGVLGLIVVSFAIWGIGDIFRGFGVSTVAQVGHTDITIDQFRRQFDDALRQRSQQLGRPISPDQARALGFDRQLLAQMLAEAALDERARDMRLGISNAAIAERIMKMPA